MKIKIKKMIMALTTTVVLSMMLFSNTVYGAFLFQSDDFHQILSETLLLDSDGAGTSNTEIQFGADSIADNNGKITWNIQTDTFEVSNSMSIEGGLYADGNVDFSNASQVRLRENSNPNLNSSCSSLGELIVNTTTNKIELCTATGNPGTWSAVSAGDADTLDGLDSLQFLRSDVSNSFTSGTLSLDSGTTLDVDGNADFSNSSRFIMRSGAVNPATCTEGEMFYNSTNNVLYLCTSANQWNSSGPQDFESIYATDSDKTLTTNNGDFSIATGSGDFNVLSTGIITFLADSFNLSLTGAFSLSAVGDSNIVTDSGDLNLSTTTSGNVELNSAENVNINAEDNIYFKDGNLLSEVQLTESATGLSSKYGTTGIIDAFNILSFNTPLGGASVIGVEDGTLTNVGLQNTSSVQDALEALDSAIGLASKNNEVLVFYPEYPDSVVYADGADNKGTLETGYDVDSGQHFYRWSSEQSNIQDIDLRFRFSLPADLISLGNFSYDYRTGNVGSENNNVQVELYNASKTTNGKPTLCHSGAVNTSSNAWNTGVLAKLSIEEGCSGTKKLEAEDVVQVIVKLLDKVGSSTFADVGVLKLNYNN